MIWSSIIWLLVLFTLLLWFPQNIHHEGSHGLAAKFFGAKEVKLYPFPEWDGTSWIPKYFAYMTYRFDSDNIPDDKGRAIISLAPQIMNTVWLTLLVPILAFVTMPLWLYTLICAFVLVQFIDGAVNLSAIFGKPQDVQDTWDFMDYVNIKTSTMRGYVTGWYLLFGSAILFPWHMLG